MPAVMPGIISTAKPCCAAANNSSPPRPKINGSPPFSRTTFLPRRASSMRRSLIAACICVPLGLLLPDCWAALPHPLAPASSRGPCLPTSTSSTSRRAYSSSPGSMSLSYISTSALWMARKPRSVIKSGSPGPAPTRTISPPARCCESMRWASLTASSTLPRMALVAAGLENTASQ